jgi:CRISPR-associated protein Cmr6
MSIAAAPKYLGTDFSEASPALRFGPLLPIWTDRRDQEGEVHERADRHSREATEIKSMLDREGMDAAINRLSGKLPGLWQKNDFTAKKAWGNIVTLTTDDKRRMEALLARQNGVFFQHPSEQILCVDARSVAPFTTGLGIAHPLENGFAFLNPYGLPYLPGSGVKGVLRQAARELASGEWGDAQGWDREYPLAVGKQNLPNPLSTIDLLFGLESNDGGSEHLRGALNFWDVIPQIKGKRLAIDVMTPHQSHYYQQQRDGKVAPHDCGQPIPIHFLTIPPESGFAFFVTCDNDRLARLAPTLVEDEQWKALLRAAIGHAFQWLGFGAKTAVGYGAMEIDQQANKDRTDAETAQREIQARTQMSAAQRKIAEYKEYMQGRFEALRGKPTRIGTEYQKTREFAQLALNATDWSPEEKEAAGMAIIEWLDKVVQVNIKDERKKLKISQLLQNQ